MFIAANHNEDKCSGRSGGEFLLPEPEGKSRLVPIKISSLQDLKQTRLILDPDTIAQRRFPVFRDRHIKLRSKRRRLLRFKR